MELNTLSPVQSTLRLGQVAWSCYFVNLFPLGQCHMVTFLNPKDSTVTHLTTWAKKGTPLFVRVEGLFWEFSPRFLSTVFLFLEGRFLVFTLFLAEVWFTARRWWCPCIFFLCFCFCCSSICKNWNILSLLFVCLFQFW